MDHIDACPKCRRPTTGDQQHGIAQFAIHSGDGKIHNGGCDKCCSCVANTSSIPQPTQADGYTTAELAQRKREMAVLDADHRTAGSANRPPWLVRRVLEEARRAGRL